MSRAIRDAAPVRPFHMLESLIMQRRRCLAADRSFRPDLMLERAHNHSGPKRDNKDAFDVEGSLTADRKAQNQFQVESRYVSS